MQLEQEKGWTKKSMIQMERTRKRATRNGQQRRMGWLSLNRAEERDKQGLAGHGRPSPPADLMGVGQERSGVGTNDRFGPVTVQESFVFTGEEAATLHIRTPRLCVPQPPHQTTAIEWRRFRK